MLEIPETFFQQLIIFITELHSSFQGNSTECDHYFFKALSGQQKKKKDSKFIWNIYHILLEL